MNLKQALSVVLGGSVAAVATVADGQTPKKDVEGGPGARMVVGRTNIIGTLRSCEVEGLVFTPGPEGCTRCTITIYRVDLPVAGAKTNGVITLLTEDIEVKKECRRLTGKKVVVDGVLSRYNPMYLKVTSIKEHK